MATELPELVVSDVDAWRCWLAGNADGHAGVWLVLARKGVTDPTDLGYQAALEEALCHGWIDGQVRGRDGSTYHQRFTPRRARSRWSQRNVGIVERLTAEGRMWPGGQAEIDRAKEDGRFAAAYAGPATAEVPEDLLAALAEVPAAKAMFDVLTSRNRYAMLHQLGAVKRAETRERKIAKYVAMLADGETLYPQKARPPAV